jgi:hypothetical protein
LSREQAVVESVLARWLAARRIDVGERVRTLLRLGARAPITFASVSSVSTALDPHAAVCVVRVPGSPAAVEVRGSSLGVRALADRMLSGPPELAAIRPLGVVEQSLWALVVATALEDLGIRGDVVPIAGTPPLVSTVVDVHTRGARTLSIALDVRIDDITLALEIRAPAELFTHIPVARLFGPASWLDTVRLDLPIVVGRCALHRDALEGLAIANLVTLERPTTGADADLDLFGGSVGLRARTLPAAVATGYVRRDMSLPDAAHVELTVALGTTQLSLRQITELAVGQIVQLGRPLAGPFELRAGGRVLGRGELVDVDGELAVRIVSLGA